MSEKQQAQGSELGGGLGPHPDPLEPYGCPGCRNEPCRCDPFPPGHFGDWMVQLREEAEKALGRAQRPKPLTDPSAGSRGPAPIPYYQHEAEILKVIEERDAAEEAVAQVYYLIMGRAAEWSNIFGLAEALEEIGDAVNAMKHAIKLAGMDNA